jgi:hypothetical protein
MQKLITSFLQVSPCDFSVVYGFRDKATQDGMYNASPKVTSTPWPKSYHNYMLDGKPCSLAVDIYPYIPKVGRIVGKNAGEVRTIVYMMGALWEHARTLGIPVKWGGDWDMDGDVAETRFFDSFHIQLMGIRE